MVKWEPEDKYNLSIAILEHTNPTAIPWEKVNITMGSKFGPQACRGQFNTIKKGFKAPESAEAGPSTQSASVTAKITAKGKKPATSNNTTVSTAKGRKRKVDEILTDPIRETHKKSAKVKIGADTAVMEKAEGSDTEQIQHDQDGQGGVHQGAYPDHQSFITSKGKAPYKSPYVNDA